MASLFPWQQRHWGKKKVALRLMGWETQPGNPKDPGSHSLDNSQREMSPKGAQANCCSSSSFLPRSPGRLFRSDAAASLSDHALGRQIYFVCIAHMFYCNSVAPKVDPWCVCYENSDLWQRRSVLQDEYTPSIVEGCAGRWCPTWASWLPSLYSFSCLS